MVEISAVIPTYNEERNIIPLYKELKEVLDNSKKTYEIIFINDGSTDKTEKILNSIKDKKLKVVNFRKNFGQTAAIDAGFKASKGEIVVTLDGDLQNDPRDIPRLLKGIEQGYDIVAGWRANRKDSFSKKFISKGAKLLRKFLLKDNLKDSGCTLRAYKKECIEDLNLYGEMHRFIHILLKNKGFKIAQIKVNHRPRIHGQTKYNMSRTFKSLLDMVLLNFWSRFSTRPIHLFGGWGLAFGFIGSLIILYLGFVRIVLQEGIGDRQPLLTLAVLLIVMGIQFLTFGVIADIMTKIYYKDNTNYTIKNEKDINA